MKEINKPRIFIGSSTESLDIAGACNVCLDYSAEVSMWPYIFNLGDNTLDSLVVKANNVDFALFVFSADDLTIMRNQQKLTVRDNVLFELGLFIGALGRERCFILKPRGVDLHLPTDLLGVNTGNFVPDRQDGDYFSAVNAACTQISQKMKSLGRLGPSISDEDNGRVSERIPKIKEEEYKINELQLLILARLLDTATENMEGSPAWKIKNSCGQVPDFKVDIAITKLTRVGYLERVIESDFNGNEWYGYKITNGGIEFVIENEENLDLLVSVPQSAAPTNKPNGIPDFDNDIPF
ncbi:nucleotide-binding protein [Grimontia hollisae]|uniref:ABC-type sugar transport system, periplasmic component n=1 Tax=Grimontia hollisae TaxID=673 RepID=A0A377HNE2_GRIHO|nr:nucleotide-binding protein [Grimontia hollisae]STO57614.1 ABC-type sugar transport system, periplasmic component [Grimontia hollisae]